MISELKNGPSAHAPSGSFQATAAWLTPAAIAINLTRARGTLAGTFHARAACFWGVCRGRGAFAMVHGDVAAERVVRRRCG
ncbi:hypothetical protein ACWD1Y_41860 [Streptomyces sp. NPDC002814]